MRVSVLTHVDDGQASRSTRACALLAGARWWGALVAIGDDLLVAPALTRTVAGRAAILRPLLTVPAPCVDHRTALWLLTGLGQPLPVFTLPPRLEAASHAACPRETTAGLTHAGPAQILLSLARDEHVSEEEVEAAARVLSPRGATLAAALSLAALQPGMRGNVRARARLRGLSSPSTARPRTPRLPGESRSAAP